ncbi:MAG TPA: hypothetical protein VL523_01055 [Terriglobia bacterium]|nr:hypothetical protein [Terriglobia bacterium]
MSALSPSVIQAYLESRPRLVRAVEWVRGRRYRMAELSRAVQTGGLSGAGGVEALTPILVVIAHGWHDASIARRVAVALEGDWITVPPACRDAYQAILACAPELIVLDLRRQNRCGCLGHRHPVIRERPFAEPHETFGGAAIGEIDIAWQRVQAWPALPLQETALDTRFFEGSRLEEFRSRQWGLRLLSVFLHETHHLVFPDEAEDKVRGRSLAFYRDALSSYVEEACSTLSFTIDRSFSRME